MGRPSDVNRELCFAFYDEIHVVTDEATADVVAFWPRHPFEVDGITYDASEAIYTGGDRVMIELITDCWHDGPDDCHLCTLCEGDLPDPARDESEVNI